MNRRTLADVGILLEEGSETFYILEGESLIGRGANCTLQLDDSRVSALHTTIRWQTERWLVRDLNSTNGTWLNGKRLESQTDTPLARGDRLVFGEGLHSWRVADSELPQPMVIPVSGGTPQVIDAGIIRVPTKGEDFASIFRTAEGDWQLESIEANRTLQSGDSFAMGSSNWRFSCPNQWQGTRRVGRPRLISEGVLNFRVSLDEERVEVSVKTGGQTLDMGQLSAYYFLLTLARLRGKDESDGEAADAAGWYHRDDLMRMLRCNESQLNVWVCRIRSKFQDVGFLDYGDIIERKPRTGRLRIGSAFSRVESS